MNYRRFWFEFNIENAFAFPRGIGHGIGVTAIDYNDAINIMDQSVFREIKRPEIKKFIEDVDIRNLDQGHVMLPPIHRGIWFPAI